MQKLDVVIVGAGPAGIGMAMELCKIPGLEFGILESGRVGESFQRWPAQTRLISPSFYSNPFGLADLNAVDATTSPAAFAGVQHLTGPEYAEYLQSVVDIANLPVVAGCKVLEVNPDPEGGFHIVSELGELHTEFLVWGCGEYQFPDLNPFPGAEYCRHYAHIEDWQILETGPHLVIGGYESGIDSAINLVSLGHKVQLLVRRDTLEMPDVLDPSQVLSPYTRARLNELEDDENLEIIYGANVSEVTQNETGGFRVLAKDGRFWDCDYPPVIGTGFLKGGGARQIKELWSWDDDGHIVLSEDDESVATPGLFLVGPHVRQEQRIYCFIYKFRQRFGRIAMQIGQRLEMDTEWLEMEQEGAWGPFGNSECCEGCEC